MSCTSPAAASAILPHRAGHLLKRVVFRTGEVMVLEDPGQPTGDIGTPAHDSQVAGLSSIPARMAGAQVWRYLWHVAATLRPVSERTDY